MTGHEILQADLLDILFEKRNKSYGAYQLRKTYNRQLRKALAISIGAAFAWLLLFRPSTTKSGEANENGEVVIRQYDVLPLEQKKSEPPRPPETKTPVRQQAFTDQI